MFSSINESLKVRCGEEVGVLALLLNGEFAGDGDLDLKNILKTLLNPKP